VATWSTVNGTRTPSGVTVTVAGRAFLAEAEIAATASRRAVTAARAAGGELAGELVMAVRMGLGARQLPQVLGQLRDRYPKLQVTLYEEPDPADLERLVRQGTLDMFLVHHIPAGCTFDPRPLGEGAYVAVLPKGHPLVSDGAVVSLEDLASEGWIRFRRASLLDDCLARLLGDAGLSPHMVARAPDLHRGAAGGAGFGRHRGPGLGHPRRLRRPGLPASPP
jgi:DNA-binding transcriptional LysR family regulator